MSYILDSLKKSEEERRKRQQHQDTPYAPYVSSRAHTGRDGILKILIMLSIFLITSATIAAGWWYMTQKDNANTRRSDTITVGVDQPQPDISVEKEQAGQEQPFNIREKTEPRSTIGDESSSEIESAESTKDPLVPSIPDQDNMNNRVPIPLMTELPFSTRSMLPEMEFRGHVFSPSPSKRMIMINSAVFREGDPIDAELTLLEIRDNGLILRFRETDFRVELF